MNDARERGKALLQCTCNANFDPEIENTIEKWIKEGKKFTLKELRAAHGGKFHIRPGHTDITVLTVLIMAKRLKKNNLTGVYTPVKKKAA